MAVRLSVILIIIIIIHFIYNALYIFTISKCYRFKIESEKKKKQGIKQQRSAT